MLAKEEQILVVLELDRVLWAGSSTKHHHLNNDLTGSPVARPYLKTFFDYLIHNESGLAAAAGGAAAGAGRLRQPKRFQLAIWTRLPRSLALKNMKSLGLDSFYSDNTKRSVINPCILTIWGSEETGVSCEEFLGGAFQGMKDLDLVRFFSFVIIIIIIITTITTFEL